MSHSDKTTDEQLNNLGESGENLQEAEDVVSEENSDNNDSYDDKYDEMSVKELRAELQSVQEKADENWNTVIRMQAEMANQRKRSEKQVEDAHKYAVQKFVEELLPVADSMEMGLAAEGDIEQIREGIGLTQKVFDSTLEKFFVVAVDPLGEKFNPELHQAMAMQPSEEYEEGCVSAVMQKGYTLNGRLVRPAMVMVVKN